MNQRTGCKRPPFWALGNVSRSNFHLQDEIKFLIQRDHGHGSNEYPPQTLQCMAYLPTFTIEIHLKCSYVNRWSVPGTLDFNIPKKKRPRHQAPRLPTSLLAQEHQWLLAAGRFCTCKFIPYIVPSPDAGGAFHDHKLRVGIGKKIAKRLLYKEKYAPKH